MQIFESFFVGLFERLLSLSVGVPHLPLRYAIALLNFSLTRVVILLQLS